MKLSITACFLVSTSTVGAFQQPLKSSRTLTGLRAIAIDPQAKNIAPPQSEDPEKKNEPFDMAGIALSVSGVHGVNKFQERIHSIQHFVNQSQIDDSSCKARRTVLLTNDSSHFSF
jgi:hypothetical protein